MRVSHGERGYAEGPLKTSVRQKMLLDREANVLKLEPCRTQRSHELHISRYIPIGRALQQEIEH